MLWEYASAGRNGLVYPGKSGMRDKKMFDGRIAHRMYVFSGGAAETSLKYEAIASTISQCIATLELTKLGSYLDGDRVNYSAHILEREWKGPHGYGHPTSLMTMNTAGLKGDCLPQIFHLHSARRFFADLSRPLTQQETEKARGKAVSAFFENSLTDEDILHLFKLELPVLTRDAINQAGVSEDKIYDFLMDKISEINETGAEIFEKKKKLRDVSWFVEKAISTLSQAGDEIVLTSGSYIQGGLLFFEKLASLLDEKISDVTGNISKLEADLLDGTNQKTLNGLLESLASATKKKNGIGELVVKLGGQSPTVSLISQILDMVTRLQQQKKEKYNHLLLKHIYDTLHKFLVGKQEHLRKTVFKYNRLVSQIDRQVENIKRVGRSAFTYNKAQFDELTEHLMDQIYSSLEVLSTQQILGQLGPNIIDNDKLKEEEYLDRVLETIRPDLDLLTGFVDDLFCEDEQVQDYVKTMLSQFYMTLKLDRDRFPSLETSQSRFVICTKKFYEKHKDDLFEGYWHLETQNPYNVLVTQHEEGFPFIALSYLHRINDQFKELHVHGQSAAGHIMADLEEKLPLLDA
jgi:hypothetical protein